MNKKDKRKLEEQVIAFFEKYIKQVDPETGIVISMELAEHHLYKELDEEYSLFGARYDIPTNNVILKFSEHEGLQEMLEEPGKTLRTLATLAHEAGHVEQRNAAEWNDIFTLNEGDAFMRGIAWALKWGVFNPYYRNNINRFIKIVYSDEWTVDWKDSAEEINEMIGQLQNKLVVAETRYVLQTSHSQDPKELAYEVMEYQNIDPKTNKGLLDKLIKLIKESADTNGKT